MYPAVCKIAAEAGRRLKVLLRARRFYDTGALMRLYKAFVLPYAEGSTPAIYHAHPTTLAILDRVQTRFLEECGLTPETALVDFRLAPLSARRDMAMLGLLHRVQLGVAPQPLADLFPRARSTMYSFVATASPTHDRQFQCDIGPRPSAIMSRSLFGLVRVYNNLPAHVVHSGTVKLFQRRLQASMCSAAAHCHRHWESMYSGSQHFEAARFAHHG